MATPLVLTNARLFSGGADLTGAANKIEITAGIETRDVTNYESGGYKEVRGGLAAADLTGGGHWEAGDLTKVDNEAWASLGAVTAWTAGPDNANVGSVAWLTQAVRVEYKLLDAVGEVAPWEIQAKGSWPLARGKFAHPPGTARTTSANGTGQQLGAVASGKYIYASLHVLSVSGTDTPTITVRIESDNGAGFGTPTTQVTFTAATTIGSQITRVIGPITDDFWRPAWTISGTDPSFLFVVALGIK